MTIMIIILTVLSLGFLVLRTLIRGVSIMCKRCGITMEVSEVKQSWVKYTCPKCKRSRFETYAL